MKLIKSIYNILFVALLVAGCSNAETYDIDTEAEESKGIYRITASSSSSTKVNIDGTDVTWSEDDQIVIYEVGTDGHFMSSTSSSTARTYYTIDNETISEDGKYAEFTGNQLTEGKQYVAYYFGTNTGSLYTWTQVGLYYDLGVAYKYSSYTEDDLSVIMQSNSFEYNGSTPKLYFDHKSSIFDIEISLDKSSTFSGELKSISISNSEGEYIFYETALFNSYGEYIKMNSAYGFTLNTIEVSLGNAELSVSSPVSIKIPFTWYNAITYLNGNFVFTITATDGQTFTVTKPAQILQDGVVYETALTLDGDSSSSDDVYESTDYSKDGEVVQIQAATVGDGIDLVFVGDGFIDTDMTSGGTYEQRMAKAADHFFSEEPYTTYRDRFNVYMVKAVSKNEGITDDGETALSCAFGSGTTITGSNSKAFEYALKVPSINKTEDLLVIVVLNSSNYAGICYMYSDNSAVAYCPIVYYDDEYHRQMITHEAGGHGFAKLADEYSYSGTITASEISSFESLKGMGWYANVDVTNDTSEIQWAHFLADSRYSGLVSIYTGALTYSYGAYRPTYTSIMRYNVDGYNAPSREAIYKRIMEYSGYEYDYEEFVAYDAVNRAVSLSTRASETDYSTFIPLAPPVFINSAPEIYSNK
ncbi:MAG: M64 family metallopeptidase [Rikenellaceae bacterium]